MSAPAVGEDGFVLGLLGGELVEIGVRLGVGGVDLVELLLRLEHFAQALFDRLAHGLLGIELRLLRQIADVQVRHRHGFAFDVLVHAGHDLQQGRFARAVQAEHADLGAGEERQRDVLEDLTRLGGRSCPRGSCVDVLSHDFLTKMKADRTWDQPAIGRP